MAVLGWGLGIPNNRNLCRWKEHHATVPAAPSTGPCGAVRQLTRPPGRPYRTRAGGCQLDISGFVNHSLGMQSIKISSKVDEDAWNELKALAAETHQNVSGVLTEAIRDYIKRKRVRPEVLNHLERSIADNEELGRLLAE